MRASRLVPSHALAILAAMALAGCAPAPVSRAEWDPDTVPEAYRRSISALMWPGATRAYMVNESGDLYNGDWWVRISGHAGGDTLDAPRVIACEDRWCPVVRWSRRSGALVWSYEAVVAPEDEPGPFSDRGAAARALTAAFRDQDRRKVEAIVAGFPTDRVDAFLLRTSRPLVRDPVDRRNLFVSLRVEVRNEGAAPARAQSRIELAPRSAPAPFTAPDPVADLPWESCWASDGGSPALAWGEGIAHGRTLVTDLDVPPGERRHLRVILSAYPGPGRALAGCGRTDHEAWVTRTRRHWTREVARGAEFDLPDSAVCEAVRAARVQLLSLRERRADAWVPIGGPFHYRDVWLRDGARTMQALALSGYGREAREMAVAFLQYQWPHGPFVSQKGQLDGTGQALWAFDQVLLRSGSPVEPRFAQAALQAWRALERNRTLSSRAPGRMLPGLLPETDPYDNELVKGQLVGNDAWAIAGYRAAARLLAAAGMAAEADSVARAEGEYRARFRDALERSGRRDIPPSWRGGGNDWGNLAVGYPCMTLDAWDPHLAALADRYWMPIGGAGLGYARNPDSLHGYVGSDLGTWAMLAGRRADADRVCDAQLFWRSASGGAAEVFPRSTRDFGINFPPHPTAAAALLTLVRNALIFDDGDTLALTLGAREAWWKGSRVRRAPTRWGTIDLAFRRDGARAEWRWTPVPVWTALALPPGERPAGPLPAPFRPGARPDLVLVPPGVGGASITLAPTPRSRPGDASLAGAREAGGAPPPPKRGT